jgi:hypothetical protein
MLLWRGRCLFGENDYDCQSAQEDAIRKFHICFRDWFHGELIVTILVISLWAKAYLFKSLPRVILCFVVHQKGEPTSKVIVFLNGTLDGFRTAYPV